MSCTHEIKELKRARLLVLKERELTRGNPRHATLEHASGPLRSLGKRCTYPLEGGLGVVALAGVNAVVDEGEAAGSAAAELGFQSKDVNALFLGLQDLGEFGLDGGLVHAGLIGVDELDRGLLAGQQGVLQEFTDVKNELRICHTK